LGGTYKFENIDEKVDLSEKRMKRGGFLKRKGKGGAAGFL